MAKFKLADKFGYVSPLDEKPFNKEWQEKREKEKEEREAKEEKALRVTAAAGVFIEGLDNEQQINLFRAKTQELVPSLILVHQYDDKTKKGHIYKDTDKSSKVDILNPVQKLLALVFNDKTKPVRLYHIKTVEPVKAEDDKGKPDNEPKSLAERAKVKNYDYFAGSDYQYFDIDSYNATTQPAFFIYALTHLIREFLWAVELKITRAEAEKNWKEAYEKAHQKTLLQDLEIFSYLIATFYGNKCKEKGITKWKWWEELKSSGLFEGTPPSFSDGKSISTIIIKDSELELVRYPAVESKDKNKIFTSAFTSLSFLKLETMETIGGEYEYEIFDKL